MLPTVILPGAQKSATTTLASILSSHDDVCIGQRKEPHYYSRDNIFSSGIGDYQSLYSGCNCERILIDASTSYLPVSVAPQRIFETLGKHVRFIITLRNPVDRAVSGFMQMKVNESGDFRKSIIETLPENIDGMTLEDILRFEKQQIYKHSELGKIRLKPPSWGWGQFPFNYFFVSCYSIQINKYLNYFPIEQFLFLTFEEIIRYQAELKSKIAEFVGIDRSRFSVLSNIQLNESKVPDRSYALFSDLYRFALKKRMPIKATKAIRRVAKEAFSKKTHIGFSTSIYNKLIDIFDPEISQTAELTGLNLEEWKKHR